MIAGVDDVQFGHLPGLGNLGDLEIAAGECLVQRDVMRRCRRYASNQRDDRQSVERGFKADRTSASAAVIGFGTSAAAVFGFGILHTPLLNPVYEGDLTGKVTGS